MRTTSHRLVLALAFAISTPAGLAAHPLSSAAGALGAAAASDDTIVLVKKGGGGKGKGHAKGHAKVKHAGKHHRRVVAPRRAYYGHCHWHAGWRHCHPPGRGHPI